jgi:ribose 5-phosphate isomerase B
MRVAVGCDHGGYALKAEVLAEVRELGYSALDFGTHDAKAVDYPDLARAVAQAVVTGEADLGVLICGTGIGMSIAANKVRGAYAAHANDCYSARMARLHNGANILALGGRVLGPDLARLLVTTFLTTEPSAEERHQRRRGLIAGLEEA